MVLLSILLAVLSVTPLNAQAWIEYAVTGEVDLENREEDVVMCSVTDEAFLVHTLGAWNVSIETDNQSPGEHAAKFMVAAPDSLAALHDSSADDRLRGDGTITITHLGIDVTDGLVGLSAGNGIPDYFVQSDLSDYEGCASCDCPYQCDYDETGALDALDLAALVDALFAGGPNPQDPACPTSRGDFNNSGDPDGI